MEYPEEIYETTINGGKLGEYQREWGLEGAGRRRAYLLGYEAGKAEQADPLAGFSNLTEAIKAGDPIDYEKLDGLKVQCVNPDVGTIRGTLKRDPDCLPDICGAWWGMSMDDAYINALVDAWHGQSGWTLWVEGEIPLRRKTADQLPVGTYFRGEVPGYSTRLAYVGGDDSDTEKRVHYAPSMEKFRIPASEWEVLEEYGTFQKPEGK